MSEKSIRKKQKRAGYGVRCIAFSAMSIAIATLLSFLKPVELPLGGSLTICSMLFVTLIGYWYGLKAGLLGAVAYGILQLIIEPYVIMPAQLVVDYILAFGMCLLFRHPVCCLYPWP